MFIKTLIDFYDRNRAKMKPPCHRSLEIDWLLELDDQGAFRGLTNVGEQNFQVIAPASMRSGGKVLAHLVVDNASYVLGHWKTSSTGRDRYNCYCSGVARAAEQIDNNALQALNSFAKSESELKEALSVVEEKEVDYKDTILPVVEDMKLACGVNSGPTELHKSLHREWARIFSEEYGAYLGQCLSCGEKKPILDRHEKVSLFGLYTSFVNMNEDAFMSHGLGNSANAPMCAECVPKYVQPLRYLAGSERHKMRTRYDYEEGEASGWLAWLRDDDPGFTFDFVSRPEPEDALDALKSLWRSRSRSVDANRFYAVSITASDNRFSIRNFQSLSLERVIEKTKEYFDRQALIRYGEHQTYSLFSLLEAAAPLTKNQSTGRQEPDRERLPPRFADALVEHILTGHALPKSLRDRALRRCRAEQSTAPTSQDDRRRVDYAVPVHRAALLKLFLSSQSDEPMPTKELDREHPDPAYHCGRYLAVADKVYYAESDGNLENYVSKRYYSSASTTPASVIGRIIPNVQHRLDKLRRERGGQATNLDKSITQIMGQIGGFPKTLQPNEQALFALGFYHQRDHEMTSSADDDDA
jgi:CRISPR-associated protein Csd1